MVLVFGLLINTNANAQSIVNKQNVHTIKLSEIKRALNNGADINGRDKYGMTSLMWASALNDNINMVKYLMQNGADINAKDNRGKTALILAAARNTNVEFVKYLIANGGDVNGKDKGGLGVLMWAIYKNPNVAVAKFLIDKGADVDAVYRGNQTPIILATLFLKDESKRVKIVRLLLKNGAEVSPALWKYIKTKERNRKIIRLFRRLTK